MSSADVAAVVMELRQRLLGAKIGKVYQDSENEIRIALQLKGGEHNNLVIEAGKRFHLTAHPQEAPREPKGFPMLLRKHLSGGRVSDLRQYGFDRIVELHAERAGVKSVIICELFSRGNIILLDGEGRIMMALKYAGIRDMGLGAGDAYRYPEITAIPAELQSGELSAILSQSDSDIGKTFALKLNLGTQLTEEICTRAGIEKNTPARDADAALIYDALREVTEPLRSGMLRPHIVLENGVMIDVLPFEIKKYSGFEKKPFENFNDSLDEYFSVNTARTDVSGDASKKEHETGKKTPARKSPLEFRLTKQMEAVDRLRREADSLIKKGELIYSEYGAIEELLAAVREARETTVEGIKASPVKSALAQAGHVTGVSQAEHAVVVKLGSTDIALDYRLPVQKNAQKYYDMAKVISQKRGGAEKAILETQELLKKEMREPEKPESRKMEIPKQKKHWYESYRWFFSSDGFLVVGGRDADSNEELVKKHMQKADIFFHTHVSGSPAVVVKTEGREVPGKTLEEAACFTVSYSGIWKSGQASGDCYYVTPEQVSKTPEHGEYVPKGAFIIRGRRNYFKDVPLRAAVGLEDMKRLIGGPPDAVKQRAAYVLEVEPGEFAINDLAQKIYAVFTEKLGDRRLAKAIAPPDKIALFLPPGGSRIKA